MTMTFTDTDTNGPFGIGILCSSGTFGTNPNSSLASIGGTPGIVGIGVSLAGDATNTVFHNKTPIKCVVPAGATWEAGTWTVRINITTSNMNLTLQKCAICRVDSSDVNQETIGESTGLGISLGTTGVKTINVTGAAVTPNAGDQVIIVFAGDNGSMNLQAATRTPDQNIDSPFTVVTPSLVRNPNPFLPHLVRRVADFLKPKAPAWTRARSGLLVPLNESIFRKAA